MKSPLSKYLRNCLAVAVIFVFAFIGFLRVPDLKPVSYPEILGEKFWKVYHGQIQVVRAGAKTSHYVIVYDVFKNPVSFRCSDINFGFCDWIFRIGSVASVDLMYVDVEGPRGTERVIVSSVSPSLRFKEVLRNAERIQEAKLIEREHLKIYMPFVLLVLVAFFILNVVLYLRLSLGRKGDVG